MSGAFVDRLNGTLTCVAPMVEVFIGREGRLLYKSRTKNGDEISDGQGSRQASGEREELIRGKGFCLVSDYHMSLRCST
jgi:hypothetical protein